MKIRILAAILAVLLVAGSASADIYNQRGSAESSEISPVLDVLVMRPMGITLMAGGAIVCAVACTFATLTPNGATQTFDELVIRPTAWTFVRPVGQFQ